MKTSIASGTIKFQGENIPVLRRELKGDGNYAKDKNGRTFFSNRKTGYVETTPKPVETTTEQA